MALKLTTQNPRKLIVEELEGLTEVGPRGRGFSKRYHDLDPSFTLDVARAQADSTGLTKKPMAALMRRRKFNLGVKDAKEFARAIMLIADLAENGKMPLTSKAHSAPRCGNWPHGRASMRRWRKS